MKHTQNRAGWLLTLALLALASSNALAGDWPHWRGLHYDGSADEANLPATLNATDNVLWTVAMPGPSAATPAVVGDRLYVVSTDTASKDVLAICFDAKKGEELWRRKIGTEDRQYPRNTMASPSPIADAGRVVFLCGTGAMSAYDPKGELLWTRNLEDVYGPMSLKYGYSSSPLLIGERLYVQMLRDPYPSEGPFKGQGPFESFLLCLDPATGKDLWKQTRETDAYSESFQAYTSPLPFESSRGLEIVITGGDYITGHNPETGAELWRHCYVPDKFDMWRLVPSHVAAGDVIVATQPRGGNLILGVRGGEAGTKKIEDALWTFGPDAPPGRMRGQGTSSDVPTPLFYKGLVYTIDERQSIMVCLRPKTGELVWEGELPGSGNYYSSPTASDGKIYCVTLKGDTVVVAAGEKFELLSSGSMGPNRQFCSSVAIASGRLFVRSDDKLFCIGNQ